MPELPAPDLGLHLLGRAEDLDVDLDAGGGLERRDDLGIVVVRPGGQGHRVAEGAAATAGTRRSAGTAAAAGRWGTGGQGRCPDRRPARHQEPTARQASLDREAHDLGRIET